MTSGRVSPSDLPDSPGQSRPYSPNKLHHTQPQHLPKRAPPPINQANGFPSARPSAVVVASTVQRPAAVSQAVVGFQQSTSNQLNDEQPKLKTLPTHFDDDDDDLEEVPVVKTYKEEGTPAIFSSRTSLSGLTFTDDEREEEVKQETTNRNVRKRFVLKFQRLRNSLTHTCKS
jgi:hypothetical protein